MILSGSRPFPGKRKVDIFKKILNHEPDYSLVARYNNKDCTDFIAQCLNKDPHGRPTISQLFESPWMQRWQARDVSSEDKA